MSAAQVSLPPAEASSQLFSDALKVCIAQQAFKASVDITSGIMLNQFVDCAYR
jgi:hypothetical protein